MILPVQGTTAVASYVSVMSGIHDISVMSGIHDIGT